jgi:hypothetical protein
MEAKRFSFYNRDHNTLEIVGLEFFTDENGFDNEDIEEISTLKIAESVILGMDDVIVTRIWED